MILTIDAQRTATVILLRVTGDIDTGTVGELDLAITEALRTDPGSLLIDLAAATFCDCAAVTALLVGRRNATAQDVAFQVINPSGICLTVLQILDLHDLLTTRTLEQR